MNPLQYLVDIILILSPDKKISNIRFWRGNQPIVVLSRYIIEGIEQQNTLENSHVGSSLIADLIDIWVISLGNGSIAGYIILKDLQYIIPQVIGCNEISIQKMVFAIQEFFYRIILAKELKDTSTRRPNNCRVMCSQGRRTRMQRE